MRIGMHTFAFNMSEDSPIKTLPLAMKKRGHDVVFLDTDKAKWDKDQMVFPALPAGARLDTFISYLPSSDPVKLWSGIEPGEIPFFSQVQWLSSKYPSPTSHATQLIDNSKTLMAAMFKSAGVPAPVSYDGRDPSSQEKILSSIREGKTMVFKPDFGGSGEGITKTNNIEEAVRNFRDYGANDQPFLVQEFVENFRDEEGRIADYRAVVVGDKVVGGLKRTALPDEWRTNNALGSKNSVHYFTPEQEADAVKATQAANLGYAGVDMLIDAHTGKHFVCEINACLDMTILTKVRPDLDLPDLIIQMVEQKYSKPETKSLYNKEFFNAVKGELLRNPSFYNPVSPSAPVMKNG